MTWTDNRGKRMRLWIPEDVGAIADPQEFMETLVARAVGIFEKEPIDIYANPTYLPAQLSPNYDALWTEPRMLRLIRAAKANDVAIELNGNRLPSEKFVRLAKAEGIKFAFATNNTGADDLKRCEYGLEMVTACRLTWQDFWTPRPVGDRAVDRKPKALKQA
jgi:histidinol phosphatase-like PHP family hydrolase